MLQDENDYAIVKSVISLAKVFKREVIAEGVENEMQKNFLINHGCTYMQGFYFSRPMPVDEMEKLLYSIHSSGK